MLQAVRSATNQRRQKESLGRRTSIQVGGGEQDNLGEPSATPRRIMRQPSRFRESIMQTEELAVRRLRASEVAKGGLLLRVFGIGKTFGGLPGSRLIHPNSPFAMCLLCCSGAPPHRARTQRYVPSYPIPTLPPADRCLGPQHCSCSTRHWQALFSWASCGSWRPVMSPCPLYISTSLSMSSFCSK
jgi:hypothetical protein